MRDGDAHIGPPFPPALSCEGRRRGGGSGIFGTLNPTFMFILSMPPLGGAATVWTPETFTAQGLPCVNAVSERECLQGAFVLFAGGLRECTHGAPAQTLNVLS